METKLNKIKNYVKENDTKLLVTAGMLTSYVVGCCVGYKCCKKVITIGIDEVMGDNVVYKNIKIIKK